MMPKLLKRLVGRRRCPFCDRPLNLSASSCRGCNREVASLTTPLILLTLLIVTILAGLILALTIYHFLFAMAHYPAGLG